MGEVMLGFLIVALFVAYAVFVVMGIIARVVSVRSAKGGLNNSSKTPKSDLATRGSNVPVQSSPPAGIAPSTTLPQPRASFGVTGYAS